MLSMDLNCDMGESFGAWRLGDDEALMRLVTSANIACSYHAGDPPTIERTVRLALEQGVAIGAHPSYPDLQGFGRRSMRLTPDEARSFVLYQVAALEGIVRANGGTLHHVKLHGALYNDAARDATLASAAAEAVLALNRELFVYALAGSVMATVASEAGLPVVEEAFADRRYEPDASLQSRHVAGALITDPGQAAAQAREIVLNRRVTAHDGTAIPMHAGTLCIHGDSPAAVSVAHAVREALVTSDVELRSPGTG